MPTPSPSNSESLFATWLAQRESGEATDFGTFCQKHPEQAEQLRELKTQWERIEKLRQDAGLTAPLSERLESRYGSQVDPKVALESEDSGRGDFSSEVLSRLAGREPASTRYTVKGEVAHGGMGAVLRVWDEDLRRHLAMKVMLGEGAPSATGDTPPADPRMLARFLEEAQVTGQLDHPGIVPVHELGLDADGRVFFTMKLVKGQTLKGVFDELAKGEGGWTQIRVLGLLLKVCEAMSYSHAKSVIHRDLKPANVMVGRYGEVYVMDWGLAKVLGREDEKDVRISPEPVLTTRVKSDRQDHVGETPDSPLYTMDGDVVGTPAYMSPEQAAGKVSEMGPPSDVYALGAMLYHLISGHMPYVRPGDKANNYAVWRWVKDGPPTSLHKEAPDAPAELVSICEKAMEREPGARYVDTSALAEDLSAYIEGRVVHAYEAGALAEAKKWVQRNKALAAALAAVLVVTVGGLGGIGYVQAEGRAAERAQRERADLKAVEAEENEQRAVAAEQEARTEAERATLAEAEAQARADELELVADFQAEQLSELDVELMGVRLRRALIDTAPEERREQLTNNLAGLNFTDLALGTLRDNLFARTVEAIDTQFEGQQLVQARLLQTMAITLEGLGLLEMASDPQGRALAIRRTESGDEHPDTLTSISFNGALLMARGKLSEAEPYFREALEGRRRVLGDEHPDTLASINDMGFLLEAQGKLSEAEPYGREALEGLRHVLGDDHPDTLNSIAHMGFLLHSQGQVQAAELYYREALEGRRRTLGDEHPKTLTSTNNMGNLLMSKGRLREAEPYLLDALERSRRVLGDEHPSTLNSINSMGNLLLGQGRLSEAEAFHREALEGFRRTLGADHPKTLASINNMGNLLLQQGGMSEAEAIFREGLDGLRRTLGDDHPTTLIAINNLGGLLHQQGRLPEAESFYREAIEGLRRVRGDEHPHTLALVGNMGALLLAQGKLSEAEPHLREALESQRRVLGDEHPSTLLAINSMAKLLQAQGKLSEAELYFRETLGGVLRVLGNDHPNTLLTIANFRSLLQELVASTRVTGSDAELGEALAKLGGHLVFETKHAQAETALLEALGLLDGDPYLDVRIQLATSDLGAAIAGQGRLAEAESWLLESAEWVLATPRSETVAVDSARTIIQRVIDLYDTMHTVDPSAAHNSKAKEWRGRLAAWSGEDDE